MLTEQKKTVCILCRINPNAGEFETLWLISPLFCFGTHKFDLISRYICMTKNKSPFITPPTLPDLFRTRANESTLLSMQPGEITWVVPWTIYNCAEHGFWTRVGIEQRGEEYGGTLNTKIVRDDEAFILDLTATDGGDLHGLCEPTSCMGEVNEHPVIFTGVLWPLLTVENGKYDPKVESYNLEQIAIHDQFSGYFETKYGNPYELASSETYVSPDFD